MNWKLKIFVYRIYLDHAAATPLDPHVQQVMREVEEKFFGNPSSIHEEGRRARMHLDRARDQITPLLNCRGSEFIFTSGGTEGNNLALFGVAEQYASYGKHIIVSAIEHPSVLEPVKQLEKQGWSVTYLPVDHDGLVDLKELSDAIKEETVLVSVMYANNEIGTIEPIQEIAALVRKKQKEQQGPPFFHTDACQAAAYCSLDVEELGVDLMTLNGGKISGPHGSGVLYIRDGIEITPRLFGGKQEYGRRAGTEVLSLVSGFAEALIRAQTMRSEEAERVEVLSAMLWKGIKDIEPAARLNGHTVKRLPNFVHCSFPRQDGDELVLALDEEGVAVSTGSACSAGERRWSHVIDAMHMPAEYAKGNLRITLGRGTTEKDIQKTLEIFQRIYTHEPEGPGRCGTIVR